MLQAKEHQKVHLGVWLDDKDARTLCGQLLTKPDNPEDCPRELYCKNCLKVYGVTESKPQTPTTHNYKPRRKYPLAKRD